MNVAEVATETEADSEMESKHPLMEEMNIELRTLRTCMHSLSKLKTPSSRKRVLDWVNGKIAEELYQETDLSAETVGLIR